MVVDDDGNLIGRNPIAATYDEIANRAGQILYMFALEQIVKPVQFIGNSDAASRVTEARLVQITACPGINCSSCESLAGAVAREKKTLFL